VFFEDMIPGPCRGSLICGSPLWVFFSGTTAAEELSIDSFLLGESLAKAREAFSGYAFHYETLDGAVYRTIAAKRGEAFMLGSITTRL